MSFADDEQSSEQSQPSEGIELQLPAVTYRIATGDQDVIIGGQLYRALSGQRGEIAVVPAASGPMLELSLPVSHPAVKRYIQNLCPPRQVVVNVWRQQKRSGEAQRVWTGFVTTVSIDAHVAKLSVPSRMGAAMTRRLPSFTVSRTCPHVLYDRNCRAARAGFAVSTTAALIAGEVVTVADISGKPDQWAQYGELLHLASGERMSIGSQVGAVVTMQFPIAELKGGDAVQVFAGCDHAITTCRDKFANVDNFGGQPQLPVNNPFAPLGLGILFR